MGMLAGSIRRDRTVTLGEGPRFGMPVSGRWEHRAEAGHLWGRVATSQPANGGTLRAGPAGTARRANLVATGLMHVLLLVTPRPAHVLQRVMT